MDTPSGSLSASNASAAAWGKEAQDLIDDFDALEAWEDRYRLLIALGRAMAPLAEGERIAANRVDGCASRVWLVVAREQAQDGSLRLSFRGESDALIVQGLVAMLLMVCSGRSPAAVLALDFAGLFARLGLGARLSPQRVNGLAAMTGRVLDYARAAWSDALPDKRR